MAAPLAGAIADMSWIMSDPEDIDATAAEYALGTLDLAERIAVAARRQREPALAAAIDAWELRFGPLGETVPSVAPPADLWPSLEARSPVQRFHLVNIGSIEKSTIRLHFHRRKKQF